MNKIDLAGRAGIVTGGARGIGYAIAARFLESGAKVALWDRDSAALEKAAAALGAKGAIVTATADVTNEESLRKAFAAAEDARKMGQRTLLFVDEIHRFNRAQQDGFLPFVESGAVTLVGATTENPSFELNAALLSRAQVLILHRLDAAALENLLARAEELEGPLPLTSDARAALVASADGDHLLK